MVRHNQDGDDRALSESGSVVFSCLLVSGVVRTRPHCVCQPGVFLQVVFKIRSVRIKADYRGSGNYSRTRPLARAAVSEV